MNALVVDTSSWISFFRGSSGSFIEDYMAVGGVLLAPVVCAKLLSAPLKKGERERLVHLLASLPLHSCALEHWVRVGLLREKLAKVGVVVSTPDAHVAQCAIDADARLLTEDKLFTHVARNSALNLL